MSVQNDLKLNSFNDFNKNVRSTLFVDNISTDNLNDSELNDLFDTYGIINEIKVFNNCLFVRYECEDDALNASSLLDNQCLKGSYLKTQLFTDCEANQYINTVLNGLDLPTNNINQLNQQPQQQQQQQQQQSNGTASNTDPQPIDCEIILTNRQLQFYANTINEKIKELGLNTNFQYLKDENCSTSRICEDLIERGILYGIHLTKQNEQFKSVNLLILTTTSSTSISNQTIKEHHNLPLDQAIANISDNYGEYTKLVDDFYENLNKKLQQKSLPKITPSLSKLINGKSVSPTEIDGLIDYLKRRKQLLLQQKPSNSTPSTQSLMHIDVPQTTSTNSNRRYSLTNNNSNTNNNYNNNNNNKRPQNTTISSQQKFQNHYNNNNNNYNNNNNQKKQRTMQRY